MIPLPKCGIASIEFEEGFRSKPYPDSGHPPVWTYGIGSVRDLDGRPVTASTPPCTREQAELLLARDAGNDWQAICRAFAGIRLTENQLGALLSFAYNEGVAALEHASLLASVRAGREPREDEWTRWCLAGRPLRRSVGLYQRRLREAALYAT